MLCQGPAEVDETYVDEREINKHADKKLRAGRGTVGKTPLVGLKNRPAHAIRVAVVPDNRKATLQAFVRARGRDTWSTPSGCGRGAPNQEPCAAQSSEITALPRLLGRLALQGALVTIDAAGCQTAIVQALRPAPTACWPSVQRNQDTFHREVKVAFDDAGRGAFRPVAEDRCKTIARNGGRRARRIWTVLGGPASTSGRRAVRYYIASRLVDAEALPGLVCDHWKVENGLNRTLGMQFQEDDGRMRTGHAPAAMGILRRATLNRLRMLQQHFS